ncbi:ribosomal protein, partial [Trifolium pratense]
GSNNDINVLNQSNVFNDILEGHAPNVQYTINGTPYNMGYYLADGIYPEWATFVKTISMPQGEKKKLFAQHQESARKDVERAFGVLQSRFAIIRGPARAWHIDTLKHTIYACIILHNMIVEDERHTYGGNFDYSYDNVDDNNSTTETFSGPHPNLATRLQRRASIREKQVHRQLQGNLVEYIWERFGHVDDEV